MAPTLGIIADDYTGALMVASYLEGAGIPCPVVFNPSAVGGDAPVVIAGTRTRTVAVQEALAELETFVNAFVQAGCTRFAYKACASFDSTSEGNIGPAADFLAERTGVRPVLMAAGFPLFNITVHQGYLFYRGRLVSESIKRLDPLTPMSDPDLVRFLSRQTKERIGLVNHSVLRKGAAAVAKAVDELSAQGNGHIFFDASDDDDIANAASFAATRKMCSRRQRSVHHFLRKTFGCWQGGKLERLRGMSVARLPYLPALSALSSSSSSRRLGQSSPYFRLIYLTRAQRKW